jgi:hypothetical protein
MTIEKKTEGFGSFIEKAAKLIKADIAADEIAKALGYDDCGCNGRKEALNKPNLIINKVLFNKNKNKDEQK